MIDLLKCKHFKGQNGQHYPKTNRIKCPTTSNDWQPRTDKLEGHHVDTLLNTCLSLGHEALQGGKADSAMVCTAFASNTSRLNRSTNLVGVSA